MEFDAIRVQVLQRFHYADVQPETQPRADDSRERAVALLRRREALFALLPQLDAEAERRRRLRQQAEQAVRAVEQWLGDAPPRMHEFRRHARRTAAQAQAAAAAAHIEAKGSRKVASSLLRGACR